MAIIPAGSKVMTVASTVDTSERKSSQANSPTQYYTIEDITETVGAGLPAAPTTTTVNILSAQILAMNSTPIELLPVPSANTYYNIKEVVLEYTYNTAAFDNSDIIYITLSNGSVYMERILFDFINQAEDMTVCFNDISYVYLTGSPSASYAFPKATPAGLYLNNYNANPTTGSGTIKAKITYELKTFGA